MINNVSRSRALARRLRRDQTDSERHLWTRLRARQICGAKFRRQQPIGVYIVDFCCLEKQLVIKLDGSQHLEQADKDLARTQFLSTLGYRVLRFWDHDALQNTEAVLQRIAEVLEEPSPPPSPVKRERVIKSHSKRTQLRRN
jgi:very-short-patch-repair endonuclease